MRPREDQSRRNLLKGMTALGAGVAAAGVFRSSEQQALAAPVPTTHEWDRETDVIVAGAGLGGICAALAAVQVRAQEAGYDDDERISQLGGVPGQTWLLDTEGNTEVILLEASNETGGTALFSAGMIHAWAAETYEDLRNRAPLLDPILGRVYMDQYAPTLDWLRASGIPWPDPPAMYTTLLGENILSMGNAYSDRRHTTDLLVEHFQAMGGVLMTQTKVVRLFTDEQGHVIGVRTRSRNGESLDIRARRAVVLASGGFGANKELSVRYLGISADNVVHRSVPYNRGEALLMATAAGALLSRSIGTFYGHLQAYPPIVPQTEEAYEEFDKQLLRELMGAIQGYAPQGIAVNLNGKRFVDESLGDDMINQAIVHQDEGRVFILLDAQIATPLTNMELLQQNGAVVEIADTLEELVEQVSAHRVDAVHLMATIEQFNEAVDAETTRSLNPPKARNVNALATPPFYAIQATSGISAPYGGILINGQGQVLGYGELPIQGLYAVPHAAGGIFYKHYGGSLALCAVFGRLAGIHAAVAEPHL